MTTGNEEKLEFESASWACGCWTIAVRGEGGGVKRQGSREPRLGSPARHGVHMASSKRYSTMTRRVFGFGLRLLRPPTSI
jgi:hypothetical protein